MSNHTGLVVWLRTSRVFHHYKTATLRFYVRVLFSSPYFIYDKEYVLLRVSLLKIVSFGHICVKHCVLMHVRDAVHRKSHTCINALLAQIVYSRMHLSLI